ncbi:MULTISPECIES: DUF4157 domain-containing protein [Moorena]|uniref:DUF4157 domain-containing protein n=1 Tax=Moorena producens (strain JHB) TaxID=1454205 RepID=A0A1D9G2N1_MOOP1|nr:MULTISPECIES: DUF4157 domain-containing protein [Moorena]AOY81877.2 DUF4157 domain-containing protein [Moorena producens JHB]
MFRGLSHELRGNWQQGNPVQAKLTIGEAGDKYELEADRVASEVVDRINAPVSSLSTQHQSIQAQGQQEELKRKPMVQLQSIEGGMAATPELESSIQQARGSGMPIALSIRKPMEQSFGADFSGVRVHNDAQSDQLNQSIQARAFTTGKDIFFRQGEYNPGSRGGQELIAHELTHVVQQKKEILGSSGRKIIQRAIAIEAESDNEIKVERKDENKKDCFTQIKDTKKALAKKGKVAITSDNGNLEFVTDPMNNSDEIKAAHTDMKNFLNENKKRKNDLVNQGDNIGGFLFSGEKVAGMPYQIRYVAEERRDAEKAKFVPQATLDIPFKHFGYYIDLLADKNNKDYRQLIGKSAAETAQLLKLKLNEEIIEETINQTDLKTIDSQEDYRAVIGYLKMLLMALIETFDANTKGKEEDPKYAFATMPRNRFSEMYEQLKAKDSIDLEKILDIFSKKVLEKRNQLEILPDIFSKGLYDETGKKVEESKQPTVSSWISSIKNPLPMDFIQQEIDEGKDKDKQGNEWLSDVLSPPEGYRTKREGLGAYELNEQGVPFFELRDFMSTRSNKNIPSAQKIEDIMANAEKLFEFGKKFLPSESKLDTNFSSAVDDGQASTAAEYSPKAKRFRSAEQDQE